MKRDKKDFQEIPGNRNEWI